MSHSEEASRGRLAVAPSDPESVESVLDFDVRSASSRHLINAADLLEDAICAAGILDPVVPELIRREYCIRQELGRRDVLLMQGTLWATTEPAATPLRIAGQALINAVRTRNGRGGPGGPGDWDD